MALLKYAPCNTMISWEAEEIAAFGFFTCRILVDLSYFWNIFRRLQIADWIVSFGSSDCWNVILMFKMLVDFEGAFPTVAVFELRPAVVSLG